MKTMQHRLSFALIVVLLVALFMQPALAQDGFATNTAPPDAAATVEFVLVPRESLDTFMDLTPAREDALAGVDDAPPPDDTVTVPSWLMQNYLLVLPLLTIVAMLLQNFMHDRSLKRALDMMDKRSADAVEAAYEALPDVAQGGIQAIINLTDKVVDELGGVVRWARRVTDGQPNTEPPPLPTIDATLPVDPHG